MGVGGLESRSVLGSNRAEGAEKNVCTKAQNLSGQLDPDYSLAVVRRYIRSDLHYTPSWLVQAEIECTVHAELSKWRIN